MAELDVTKKPLPTPRPDNMPFWDGLRAGEIRLQRCDACSRVQFYPRPHCRYCGSTELTWETLSGRASVYSYTIIHRAPFEAFADDVPYALAVVQLEEGPRLISNVVTDDLDAIAIGMPLAPVFDPVSDDVTLLRFRPA
jgi:uncharacterized OB-fold protein